MKRIAILVVAISLGAMVGVASAITAATSLGSDHVYTGATIPDSSWTECPSSGPVADAYGHVYQTIQGICAVGEPLPFVFPIGGNVYKPDWKRCMIRNYFKAYALAHAIACDDKYEGSVDAVPQIYWNNAGALNLSPISSFAAVAGSWTGGYMNSATGAFQYPYSYDGYHPNVGTIPFKGVPYINMPVEATTRTHGDVTGHIVTTARSIQVTYFVSNTFEAETAWFGGSLFHVSFPLYTLDVADEGGAVYNSNKDQNGNPCLQRNGTILYVPSDGTAWVTNYATNDLVTLSVEYSNQGRNAPGLHPAGTCVPQYAMPTMVNGAKAMTDTKANQLQANYDAMSRFFTEPRLAMFRAMPGVQRIGDSADGLGVEIGYYCAPGERCDPKLIRDEILASVDVEHPTVAEAMSKHGVSGLKVVIERERYVAGRKPKR